MLTRNSRYAAVERVTARDPAGREVPALKLRRLPPTRGEPLRVRDEHHLDVLSRQRYGDGTRYWHIADANTELQARALLREPGRTIQVPER